MNEADKNRMRQKAINAERLAEVSNKREDWLEAARLWKAAGDKVRERECLQEVNHVAKNTYMD